MSLHRITAISVFLSLALSLGAEAFAQQYHVGDIQLFRPAQITDYGDEPHSSHGFYFGVDYLGWIVSRPRTGLVGAPIQRLVFNIDIGDGTGVQGGGDHLATAGSDFTTGGFEARYNGGERIDFGYVDESGAGWGVSTFLLHGPKTTLYGSGTSVLFNLGEPRLTEGFVDLESSISNTPDGFDDDRDRDGVFGRNGVDTFPFDGEPDAPAPVDNDDLVLAFAMRYRSLRVSLKTKIYGTDVQRTWRTAGGQFGGWIEWGLGARYMGVREQFTVEGFGGLLDDTSILQNATNNIIGPQFAIRWFNISHRWMYSVDLRLVPGANFQTLQQNAVVGSNLIPGPPNQTLRLSPQGSSATAHATEFSPIADFRVGVGYKLTDYISARVGFNAIYVDGIARTPELVNYTIPGMGILVANNTQPLFMTGINVGIEINR